MWPDTDCTRNPACCVVRSPYGLARLGEPQPALGEEDIQEKHPGGKLSSLQQPQA